jgi:hypothetical protein
MLIHALTNSNGRFLAETFNQGGIKIKLSDVSLAIAFQTLMERQVPPIAEAQDLQDAAIQKVAADLLSNPYAHMLGNLLGPPCMWNNLAIASRMRCKFLIETRSESKSLRTACKPEHEICEGQISSIKSLYSGPRRSNNIRMSL